MNKVLFISYVTKETVYELISTEYLLPSLKKWGLNYHIEGIDNEHSWQLNTAQKPKVLLDVMTKYKDVYDTFIYLDADSRIQQYPELFFSLDKSIDIGYHKLDWSTWYGHKDSQVKELLTGTMVLRYNDKVVNLLQEWYHESMVTKIWEQKCLEYILNKKELLFNIVELPLEYCFITSRPGGLPPLVACNPVIEHYQASRLYKKEIK